MTNVWSDPKPFFYCPTCGEMKLTPNPQCAWIEVNGVRICDDCQKKFLGNRDPGSLFSILQSTNVRAGNPTQTGGAA